jgi:hypothetical protein
MDKVYMNNDVVFPGPQATPGPPSGLPSEKPTASFWHIEPSPLLKSHRSTRDLPEKADVVIIGSGMTGASVAHHLLNASGDKISVVLLDAREACWGATGRVCYGICYVPRSM